MKRKFLCLLLYIASVEIAVAQANPFVGTWKLNPEKSTFAGLTCSLSETATGYRYQSPEGDTAGVTLDGKDNPFPDGTTVSWRQVGPNSWVTETKSKGKVIVRGDHHLSADAKTDNVSFTFYNADATTSTSMETRSKIADGEGLAGTWKIVKNKSAPTITIITEPAPGRLRWEEPSSKLIYEGPTDGTPFPIKGEAVPEGWTGTTKITGPRTLEFTGQLRGKLVMQGTDTLSEDGKTTTSIYWYIGKESEIITDVEERQ